MEQPIGSKPKPMVWPKLTRAYFRLLFLDAARNRKDNRITVLEKINATAPQPQHNVLQYFAIFNNVAHSLEPGETPNNSASHSAPNYVQRS